MQLLELLVLETFGFEIVGVGVVVVGGGHVACGVGHGLCCWGALQAAVLDFVLVLGFWTEIGDEGGRWDMVMRH